MGRRGKDDRGGGGTPRLALTSPPLVGPDPWPAGEPLRQDGADSLRGSVVQCTEAKQSLRHPLSYSISVDTFKL